MRALTGEGGGCGLVVDRLEFAGGIYFYYLYGGWIESQPRRISPMEENKHITLRSAYFETGPFKHRLI